MHDHRFATIGAVLLLLGMIPGSARADQARMGQFSGDYVKLQIPELFTYDELVTLSKSDPLALPLEAKLRALTETPFISNEAFYRGARPHRPVDKELGRSMRVVFWNIERGMRLDDITLIARDREGFIRKVTEDRRAQKYKSQPVALQPAPADQQEIDADHRQGFRPPQSADRGAAGGRRHHPQRGGLGRPAQCLRHVSRGGGRPPSSGPVVQPAVRARHRGWRVFLRTQKDSKART
jgi:hypothetical protein